MHAPCRSLLACVERSGTAWLLVLDDLQRASGSVVRDVLEPLIRFMPASLTVAIATNGGILHLDLSDVASRGLVRALGPRELRFNRDEVRAVWGSLSHDISGSAGLNSELRAGRYSFSSCVNMVRCCALLLPLAR